jgi:hypothetical protein
MAIALSELSSTTAESLKEGAARNPSVVSEPVTLGGDPPRVLVELAIVVFVVEHDDRICTRFEVGEDHTLRSGNRSHGDSDEPRAIVQQSQIRCIFDG